MANLIRPTNRLQQITWVQSTRDNQQRLNFTLHTVDSKTGKTTPVAKAHMTADQITGYILKNSILKDAQQNTDDDKVTLNKRLKAFYKELDALLNMAPIEDDCSYEENTMYSDMANLKNSLYDVIEQIEKN